MINYVIKRIFRAPLPCISAVLITFAFTLLLGRLNITIDIQKQQLNKMYDNMKINCVIANPKGKTDDILITSTLIDVCISEKYRLSQFIKDPLFKRSLHYRTKDGSALLIGVNSNQIDNRLKNLPDSAFKGSNYEVYVNEKSDYKIGDIINLLVQLGSNYVNTEFLVAGFYSDDNSDTIYCPWNVICELATKLGGQINAESGSFTLADNHRLAEFKKIASEYFDTVDISGNGIAYHQSGLALIVHDKEFRTSISAITSNIEMLNTLILLYYLLTIGIGFCVSFLLTRNRYLEFILMRRIGVEPHTIIAISLLEQLSLALIGIICGLNFVSINEAFLFFISYTVGSFSSILLVFRKSIIRTRGD